MSTIRTGLLLAVLSTPVLAAPDMGPGGNGPGPMGGPPGPPPQSFFDACKNKKDGDTLTMQNAQGQRFTGTCRMVWMPAHPPQGQGPGGGPGGYQGQGQGGYQGQGQGGGGYPPPRQGSTPPQGR